MQVGFKQTPSLTKQILKGKQRQPFKLVIVVNIHHNFQTDVLVFDLLLYIAVNRAAHCTAAIKGHFLHFRFLHFYFHLQIMPKPIPKQLF